VVPEDPNGATTETVGGNAPQGDRVLLVIDGAALQVVPLPGSGTLTLGRGSQCDVVIDAGSVSRHHATLRVGPILELEDAHSSNGTVVEFARLTAGERVTLPIGVPFQLGSVTLMVQPRAGVRREEPATAASALAALEVQAARIAVGKLSVLVLGETGVGKERFAERLHEMSPRRAAPFVRINCGAITETLLESELFGHERGAFTGATSTKDGLIESADGGTAFLDEVGELPMSLQVKLLRVLEEGSVRRVGAVGERTIDVRFVAATNRDLVAEVDAGRFRRDLYFRLAGATFQLPPLRERRDEIIPLAERFLAAAATPGRAYALTEEARAWLVGYEWPGNIRELRNACERAVLLATSAVIERDHLAIEEPRRHTNRRAPTIPPPLGLQPPSADMPSQVRATVAELERQRILEALDKCAGNQTRAAEMLGISRRTLINRLDEYGIARPRKRSDSEHG
jgi:DNA-binding NtrC family response regulator